MQNPFETEPSLQQIICALILGSDHPITPSEIQKILESVDAEECRQASAETYDITDEELAATQAEADRLSKESGSEPPHAEEENQETPPPDSKPQDLKLDAEVAQIISIAGIKKVLSDLQKHFHDMELGMELVEVSGGFRFQTSSDCGKWVRKMLNKGKPARLTRPTIETLAIIAYRQPVARSEIESIRGVFAGHVIKALMEMQLVRIIGRSDLPGRPFLFGTTPTFLNHFGLTSLKDLEPIKK